MASNSDARQEIVVLNADCLALQIRGIVILQKLRQVTSNHTRQLDRHATSDKGQSCCALHFICQLYWGAVIVEILRDGTGSYFGVFT